MIFRSLKGIRQLKIHAGVVDEADHELVFEFELANKITRTYRFRYLDCEVMSAVFHEENCSVVRAKPKLFAQLLAHIHQSPEVLIDAGADSFTVRSFHKADAQLDGQNRFMSTGLSVNLSEFEQYEYMSRRTSEELIFCVREVMCIVQCYGLYQYCIVL
jgi:hypothetical protein